jgi:ATP-dependent protease ClpP protease subunit
MDQRPNGLTFKTPASTMAAWSKVKGIKAATKVEPNELMVLGEIGWEVTAKSVKEQLKDMGKGPVTVQINSPGGDAFEGIAIYNLLKDHPAKVSVKVLGLAASAASVIAMAGDDIEMGVGAMLMIHSAWGLVAGNKKDLQEFASILDSLDTSIAELYSRRSGKDVKSVMKLMEAETWLTAGEAVAEGFADSMSPDEDEEDKKKARNSMSMPTAHLPASGRSMMGVALARASAVAGFPNGRNARNSQDQSTMNIYAKKLKELQAAREEKSARLSEIMAKAKDEERDLTSDEAAEFDELDSAIATIENSMRVTRFEMRMADSANPVETDRENPAAIRNSRGAPFINTKPKDKDEDFKGQNYTRMVIAMALSRNHMVPAGEIAKARWGKTNPTLVNLIRMAAVPGGGSGSGEWGSELVQADGRYTGDFIEYLHEMTVYDKLPLREVPANVTIKGTDGAATGYWVGQSKGIPASSASASAVSLTPLKVAALAVISNELLEDSTPAAEQWVRDLLAKASGQRVDATFLSTAAASAGVSPAGMLNGVSAFTSAGATADNVRTDIEILMQPFIQNRNVSGLYWVTNPGLANALSLMRNALGQVEFPGVTVEGGTFENRPLLVGDNVGSGDVILLKPSDIWKIGDSGLRVEVSRDAAIEQDTAPQGATDTPVAASANMTSMFQEESTAIKIVRRINFQKRRDHAVQYIGDAAYGGVAS